MSDILANVGTVTRDRVPDPRSRSGRMITRHRVVFDSIDSQLADLPVDGIASSASTTSDPSWMGSVTCAEGFAYARDGWTEIRPTVDELIARIVDRVADRTAPAAETRHDVCGTFVDMGAFMEGVPECMVDLIPAPERAAGKVVRVHYNTSALGHADGECMTARGAAVIALIDIIGRLGGSVELWVECSGVYNEELATILTRVKRAQDHVDINRVMAVLGSPSWHRRVSWTTRAHYRLAGNRNGGVVASCPISCADDVNADVVVARDHSNADPIVADPDGWILDTLRGLGFEVRD